MYLNFNINLKVNKLKVNAINLKVNASGSPDCKESPPPPEYARLERSLISININY